MATAIQRRQTHGRYETAVGVGCAVFVHLLAIGLLLRQATTVPVDVPRVLEASLLRATPEEEPAAPQKPTPVVAPVSPIAPQPVRPRPPKQTVVKQLVRSPTPDEPSQPVVAQTIAPADLPPSAPATAIAAPIESLTQPRFDAAYLNNPAPTYPPLSRRMREQGRVLMRVYVDPDGAPTQVQVRQSSGHPRLDSAAEAAVRRWRFVPARRGSDAVGAWVLVPISFSLRS